MTQHAISDTPRRRGRPPGSKNRPKLAASKPPSVEVGAPSIGSPPPENALLKQYRESAERIQKSLAAATDADTIARLSSVLNTTLRDIGKLTGEGDITESQIVRSKAWRTFLARLEPVLERHPECAAELHALLDQLA